MWLSPEGLIHPGRLNGTPGICLWHSNLVAEPNTSLNLFSLYMLVLITVVVEVLQFATVYHIWTQTQNLRC